MSDDRIYTLEIGGTPILTFPASSFREAQSLLKEQWLLNDLRELKSKGDAVWDGKVKPVVRIADATEIAAFDRQANRNTHDDLPIVYLVERG